MTAVTTFGCQTRVYEPSGGVLKLLLRTVSATLRCQKVVNASQGIVIVRKLVAYGAIIKDITLLPLAVSIGILVMRYQQSKKHGKFVFTLISGNSSLK